MKTSNFHFDLPEGQIAQNPAARRDQSRLLVLSRGFEDIAHKRFSDVADYIGPNDVLVVNNTRVIPARLFGRRPTGGKVEVLLHRKKGNRVWDAMVKPGKRLKPGGEILFDDGLSAEISEELENGLRVLAFSRGVEEWMQQNGLPPLPPYIRRPAVESDKNDYQTVYASIPGAVAAPTAGLHFTPELMQRLKNNGTKIREVTLHVGMGTFLPVQTENMEDHRIHSEWAELSSETSRSINETLSQGNRVWAVGTTSVRVLEAFADEMGAVSPQTGDIDLFIHPPYEFRVVRGLITNFHLPSSSLLALVCAFGGYEKVMNAYRIAVAKGYRFYSYGDAMLLM